MFKKKCIYISIVMAVLALPSCKKDYGNLNNPTVEDYLKNASPDQLKNIVTGTESAMRNELGLYLDDIGVLGREIYRFSGADPRYTTDLLGASDATLNNTGFYIVNPWSAKYRVVKNCNLLIEATAGSSFISDAEKKGYTGFAKTIKAYQLLLLLNLTGENGIRMDVNDPKQLGPIVGYEAGLTAIAELLDDAKTDLTGAQVTFPLSSGFGAYGNAAGLLKFNRGIAARVAIYRSRWEDALDYLDESFFELEGDFYDGVYHAFGTGSGDQLNPAFFPQNQAGEVRVAHPSYAVDIVPGDDRIGKATLRTEAASNTGLSSNRDVWVYTSSTSAVPLIRNEELILIKAEAELQADHIPNAIVAINVIREEHNQGPYSGSISKNALITEILYQRRYSLFFEGHRWLDMRRYNLINELPVDRAGDDLWTAFPLPNTEQ